VCTIETKTPYRKASTDERTNFEARLSGFGTLHTAYFTNGEEWERLDIFSPTGALQIHETFTLDLKTAQPEETEAFFAPLFADRYFAGVPRSNRHSVEGSNPHILESLAADLDQEIGEIAFFLEPLLHGFREQRCGHDVRGIALNVFNLWCDKSLLVSPSQAAQQLITKFNKGQVSPRELAAAIAELGFKGDQAAIAISAVSRLSDSQRGDLETVSDALWPAYGPIIENFCAQTAHVFVGRALLYRVGEDQGVFPRKLSGEELRTTLAKSPNNVLDLEGPGTELLERVRQAMQNFLPTVYLLGEFDWWQVLDKRATLKANERAWLRTKDNELSEFVSAFSECSTVISLDASMWMCGATCINTIFRPTSDSAWEAFTRLTN
jgi:hypothetical protein